MNPKQLVEVGDETIVASESINSSRAITRSLPVDGLGAKPISNAESITRSRYSSLPHDANRDTAATDGATHLNCFQRGMARGDDAARTISSGNEANHLAPRDNMEKDTEQLIEVSGQRCACSRRRAPDRVTAQQY